MCGIFGFFARPDAQINYAQTNRVLADLYRLSESRGKESAGLHIYLPDAAQAWTLKGAVPATELLQRDAYKKLIQNSLGEIFPGNDANLSSPLAILAHSRLVTNGVAEQAQNNQPVRSGAVSMIHNGIVVNVKELWQQHGHLQRNAEVDTEIMAAMIADDVSSGQALESATVNAYAKMKGAASIAWVHDATNMAVLATNTGDLYYYQDESRGFLVFASEQYILENVLKSSGMAGDVNSLQWLAPGAALKINLTELRVSGFSIKGEGVNGAHALQLLERQAQHHDVTVDAKRAPDVFSSQADESLLNYNESRMRELRRCTRCVLPETFPFIQFDADGVCNYCHSYKPRYGNLEPVSSKRNFIDSLKGYRRGGKTPDVLVAFSGGRDSSYGLHLIKKEFGLNPITFTYDWGMVTDLARRNIARICGQLGVQNILVSADIAAKRDNIRRNVSAWLKNPQLGLVPLFMAGDKHFFSVVNQLKRQTGIVLDLWCANPLENTDFKSGFCGVSPDFDKKRVDYLSLGRKLKMAAYYGFNFLKNPRYINRSVWDTLGAFSAYYFEPRRDFYFIFDHMTWDEDEVNDVLLNEYDWELAPDTNSTWRIGDGTAPFYNYIYLTARGFSEFDTFRSNQIREGMISRDQALESILVENRPRAESLRWYLDTIKLDFNETIKRINQLDEMGLQRS